MAKKRLKVDILSPSSIRQLQKELMDYRNSLSSKCDEIVQRLSNIALPIIEQHIAEAQFTYDGNIESGADTSHYTDIRITSLNNYAGADISVSGQDILFIEFGAGIYYNGPSGTSPHPKGEEFGFTIGSYGKGHGIQKVWGYYSDSGDLVITHGVKATMPMYNAIMEILNETRKVAKEVFR